MGNQLPTIAAARISQQSVVEVIRPRLEISQYILNVSPRKVMIYGFAHLQYPSRIGSCSLAYTNEIR